MENMMKPLLMFVFVLGGPGFSLAQTQTAPANPAVTAAPAPTTAATAETAALAADFFKALGIDKTIVEGVDGVEPIFKRVPPNTSPALLKKTEQAYATALAKYQAAKPKLIQEISDQVKKDLATQFSAAELKYLMDVYKYPAMKRMQAYLDSGIGMAARKAYTEARAHLAREKKALGLPEDPPAKK